MVNIRARSGNWWLVYLNILLKKALYIGSINLLSSLDELLTLNDWFHLVFPNSLPTFSPDVGWRNTFCLSEFPILFNSNSNF